MNPLPQDLAQACLGMITSVVIYHSLGFDRDGKMIPLPPPWTGAHELMERLRNHPSNAKWDQLS